MLRAVHDTLMRLLGRPFRRRDWERRGLVGPVRVMQRCDAAAIGRCFRAQHQRSGLASARNRHVDLPVLATVCEDPRIWRLAHEILGDRLLLWRTNMFLGNPELPWHEDRYAGLFVREAFTLSAMLALEDSPPDNCTVFALGSHRLSIAEKERSFGIEARPQAFGNVRYAGQVAPESCELVPLEAGEMIVFHPALLHASSGHVEGRPEASAERMSLVFRVTTPGAELRDEAFAHGPPGDGTAVMRTIDRVAARVE